MAFPLPKIKRRKIQKYLPWVAVAVVLIIAIVIWQGFFKEEKVLIVEPVLRPPKIKINFELLESPLIEAPLIVEEPTLLVNLVANPQKGSPPLENVELLATVSGTMTGPIDYKFDCNNDGIYELEIDDEVAETYAASNLCSYQEEGQYVVRVYVKRGDGEKEKNVSVSVLAKNNSPEIFLCAVEPMKGTTQADFQFNFRVEAGDPDGDELLYDWDFGDGTEHSQERTPTHHYERTGAFAPNITVYDVDEQASKKGGSDICFLATKPGLFGQLLPFEEIEPFEGKIGRKNPFIAY